MIFLIVQNQDLDGFPLARNEQISCLLVCEHTLEYIRHNKAMGNRFRLQDCGEFLVKGVQLNTPNQFNMQKESNSAVA